ncbi:MAG: nitrate reductase molybdenum cofactor assembly chaperone [Candidatus Paceibacterota bacterium]|jgi:nitrate reductase delta subunit|nr:nitrate reductase molybdenum cofactor assembly chaperone [Candidatus Paceibacterota bacterium]
MKTYLILSLLLEYPSAECVENIGGLEDILHEEADENKGAAEVLAPLFEKLKAEPLLSLEMHYTDTFEQGRGNSLFLYEHLYGEDAARGLALSDLLEKYASHDFVAQSGELPDFVPDVLEYLSVLSKEEAEEILGRTIHLFAVIKNNLMKRESAYAAVFEVLESMSPIAPQPLEALL